MPEDVNEEEEPKLVTSTLEDFKEAVKIARVLIDNGGITLKVPSSLHVILTVDESVLENALQSSVISPEVFSKILKSEIANMITAISLESQDSYMAFTLRNVADDKEEEEGKQLIEHKLKIVDHIIIDKVIRNRFLVRTTSKVDSFEGIYWEINEKKYANDIELESLRYATIRLEFTRTPESGLRINSPAAQILLIGQNMEPLSVVFDCDTSQIDELIEALNDIRKKLEEQEEKK